MNKVLLNMITSLQGGISSKIIVGTVCYILLLIAVIVIAIINPSFPNIDSIINVFIITSASLLGLTTVENIKFKNKLDE